MCVSAKLQIPGHLEHSRVAMAPAGQQAYTVAKLKTCRSDLAGSTPNAAANDAAFERQDIPADCFSMKRQKEKKSFTKALKEADRHG